MRVHKKIGTKERLFEMFENVNNIKINESIEVHYSDGVRQMEKFNDYNQAVQFSKETIANNPKLQHIDIYNNDGGFHSTAQEDKLLSWWGDGSYWDNVSKNKPELLNKKLNESAMWGDEVKNESFDSPIAKDKEYLDKTVGDQSSQVSKYDDGTRYPVEDKLKVKDPSLEKLKGDDAPIVEAFGEEDDQDIANQDEPINVDSGEEDSAEEKPAWDENFGGEEAPEGTEVEDPEMAIDNIPAGDGEEAPELDNEIEDGGIDQMTNTEEVPHEDQIEGGLADDANPTDFCPVQIAKGIQIEMEHTDDPHKALEIAMDHLTEIPDYYDRLEAMEAEAKGEGQENDMGAPEDALLDPSKHWVDDYAPQNVSMGDEVEESYPLEGGDPEAGEEEHEFLEKAKSGEFEDENEDGIHGINTIEEDHNQGNLEDRYAVYFENADDGNGNDLTTGEPLLSFDEWLNNQ